MAFFLDEDFLEGEALVAKPCLRTGSQGKKGEDDLGCAAARTNEVAEKLVVGMMWRCWCPTTNWHDCTQSCAKKEGSTERY